MATDAVSMTRPPVLILQPTGEEFAGLGLPKPSEDIFTRIVRDPTRPDHPMRERSCTEALCGVLLNCPTIRRYIVEWFARLSECPSDELHDLDWRIETERPIGAKRDDLRIEGWKALDVAEDESLEVLWTVEVKVQAGFHESLDQTGNGEDDGVSTQDDPEPVMVNQLLNYDAWLSQQEATCKAGFVLAIPNHQSDLPTGLSVRWHCITWAGLGNILAGALGDGDLPDAEKALPRHLLAFIRTHLWSTDEMASNRLEFDHLALLRGVWSIGKECERIAVDLVAPLVPIVKESGLVPGKVWQNKASVLTGSQRSFVYGEMGRRDKEYVNLIAGIADGAVKVWLECAPSYPLKAEYREAVKQALAGLDQSKVEWHFTDGSASPDVEAASDLQRLLLVENQAEAVARFVRDALADLKAAEIGKIIRSICEKGRP